MRIAGWMVLFAVLGMGMVQAEEAEAQWMAMFSEGKRVGYYKRSRVATPDSVVTMEFTAASMDGDADNPSLLSLNETVETPHGSLVRFRREAAQPGRMMRMTGTVQGDKLLIGFMAGGQRQEVMLDWSEEVVSVDGRQQLAIKKGLKPGTRYQFRQFLPDFMAVADVLAEVGQVREVDVLGEKMSLVETRETVVVGDNVVFYEVYRDAQAKVMKVVVPAMELEMVNCSEAFAMMPPE